MKGTIYLAGPYSPRGWPWWLKWFGKRWNIRRARKVAIRLWQEGYVVLCPHLNTAHFPEGTVDYVAGDLLFVEACTEVWLLPGWWWSIGACAEFDRAVELRRPVRMTRQGSHYGVVAAPMPLSRDRLNKVLTAPAPPWWKQLRI